MKHIGVLLPQNRIPRIIRHAGHLAAEGAIPVFDIIPRQHGIRAGDRAEYEVRAAWERLRSEDLVCLGLFLGEILPLDISTPSLVLGM